MMRPQSSRQPLSRTGLTLVEMLVSTALVLFIMVILTMAFVAGLETFRQLKALGDMENNLRTATTLLRNDLENYYVAGDNGNRKKLSDPDFWVEGPPTQGFFRLWQGSATVTMPPLAAIQYAQKSLGKLIPASFIEGADADSIPSLYATDHYLHFTVKLSGERRKDYASARIPPPIGVTFLDPGMDTHFGQPRDARFEEGPSFHSPSYEVAYYLRIIGTTTNLNDPSTIVDPTNPYAGGTPIFALYRHQKLLVPRNISVNFGTSGSWPPTSSAAPPWQMQSQTMLQDFLTYNATGQAPFAELSCKKISADYFNAGGYSAGVNTLWFNDLADITVPQRRFGMDPVPGNSSTPAGDGGWPLRSELLGKVPQMRAPLGSFPYQDLSYPRYGDVVVPPGIAPSVVTTNMSLHPLLGQDPTLEGADLLISNVLSMSIQVLSPQVTNPQGDAEWVTLFDPLFETLRRNPRFYQHPNPPAFNPGTLNQVPNPTAPAVFDTWTQVNDGIYDYATPAPNHSAPAWAETSADMVQGAKRVPLMNVNIRALRITLRVWDARTQQTRQVTMIQPM